MWVVNGPYDLCKLLNDFNFLYNVSNLSLVMNSFGFYSLTLDFDIVTGDLFKEDFKRNLNHPLIF
jgi:hypothetical protein